MGGCRMMEIDKLAILILLVATIQLGVQLAAEML
jgi:hypothetical protein